MSKFFKRIWFEIWYFILIRKYSKFKLGDEVTWLYRDCVVMKGQIVEAGEYFNAAKVRYNLYQLGGHIDKEVEMYIDYRNLKKVIYKP